MLRRVLPAACALLVFTSCKRSDDSALEGSWRGQTLDANGLVEMACEIQFASDHKFTSHEWDNANSLSDAGVWRVSGGKLILNFHGDTRAADKKTVEFSLIMREQDRLTLRHANGDETILQRSK